MMQVRVSMQIYTIYKVKKHVSSRFVDKDKAFVLNIELEILDMQVKTMSYGQISLELMGEVRTRDTQFLLILHVLPAFQLHAAAKIVREAQKKKLQH